MRHKCRSCQRVFHLDSNESTPCPYCGGVLMQDQDLFGGGADTFLASSEDLEMAGSPAGPERTLDSAGGSAAGDARPEPPPPGRPSGMPSPASMITSEMGAAIRPDAFRTGPAAQDADSEPGAVGGPDAGAALAADAAPSSWRGDATRIGTAQFGGMAKTAPNLFRATPSAAPARGGARPASAKSGSGARTAALAVFAAVLAAAAGAAATWLIFSRLSPGTGTGKAAEAEQKMIEFDKALKLMKGQRDKALAENKELKKVEQKLVEEKKALSEELAAKGQALAADAGASSTPGMGEAVELVLRSLRMLERRTDLEAALDAAAAAADKAPSLVSAHRLKARALAALGRAEKALLAFDATDAVAKKGGAPGDVESLVLAGETCLTDLGDRKRAGKYYESAAALGADSPYAVVAEARALQMGGDMKGAVRKAQEAAKADPGLALAPLVTGEIAVESALARKDSSREKLLEKADEFLAEALRLDPNSARACLVRGRALLEKTKLVAADRGFGLARLEPQAEAARLLTRAAELSPGLAEAHAALAELRLIRGALRDPRAALELAENAVRLTARRDVEALVTLASARAASGDPSAAASAVEEALRLAPMKGDLRTLLGRYKAEARAVAP